MKYQHIISYVASTLWAIDRGKMDAILAALAFRAAGHALTPAEIQARIGDGGEGQSRASTSGAIAVIPIRGTIAHRGGGMEDSSGGTSCERIGAMIDQVAADPNIGTIVYDFDTPGGTVPGVQELAAKMFALRGQKTQVAQVNSLSASAGFWLASQCDEIACIPSGSVGSIGVFCVHQDLSSALEKEGIVTTFISAGKFKTAGNPFSPLDDETKAVWQARVDSTYGQFTKDVARGRGVGVAAVRDGYGQGRVLEAKEALAAGMIDRIGTMSDTLARLSSGRSSRASMRAEGDAGALAAAIEDNQREASDLLVALTPGVTEEAERARRFRLL